MAHAPAKHHLGDILLVDDTPENIGFLSALLKGRGYRARAVPSGALALSAAAAEAPDLVLLDITMPGMDGFEVCRRFKADPALHRIPIIFLSALSDTHDKVKAFAVGGVDYVTKPFKAEEITARVETHLSLRRLQQQQEASNQELVRSYQALERLEQVRQSLVQMIVHDLKNPLATIQICAQLLKQGNPLDEDQAVAAEDIGSMAQVMGRMVMDVLDVARTDEAALAPRLAAFDPHDLLEEVRREMRGLVRSARKALVVSASPELPASVVADRELLRRLVENVLDNSLKYAPRGTEVRLEAAADGPDHWRLTVRDLGKGVPPEQRERIFEPYARLERDLEQSARVSRGLGLAFCRLAAEAHAGRIWVEENQPAGSAFVVRLPVDAAGARAAGLTPAVEALPGRADPARREAAEAPKTALA